MQSKIPVSCPHFWENATTILNDGTTIPTNNNVDNSIMVVAVETKIILSPNKIALTDVRLRLLPLRQ